MTMTETNELHGTIEGIPFTIKYGERRVVRTPRGDIELVAEDLGTAPGASTITSSQFPGGHLIRHSWSIRAAFLSDSASELMAKPAVDVASDSSWMIPIYGLADVGIFTEQNAVEQFVESRMLIEARLRELIAAEGLAVQDFVDRRVAATIVTTSHDECRGLGVIPAHQHDGEVTPAQVCSCLKLVMVRS